jgi:hypothetical protein
MTRQEIFDHSGYNRIEFIFYGPGILFIALIKWCLARLGMKRLVYHPYYFVSRFEELSKFTAFNNAKWYLPPAFILAYPLWYWFSYDGNGLKAVPLVGLLGLIALAFVCLFVLVVILAKISQSVQLGWPVGLFLSAILLGIVASHLESPILVEIIDLVLSIPLVR